MKQTLREFDEMWNGMTDTQRNFMIDEHVMGDMVCLDWVKETPYMTDRSYVLVMVDAIHRRLFSTRLAFTKLLRAAVSDELKLPPDEWVRADDVVFHLKPHVVARAALASILVDFDCVIEWRK